MTRTEAGKDPDGARWKIAHRAFFTMIQALNIEIDRYNDAPTAARLDRISDLLLGTAAAMRLAADFRDTGYEPIRAAMAAVHADFSGSFSSDHQVMIAQFRKLRGADRDFPQQHARLQAVLSYVYETHACICERYVGQSGSLANAEADAPALLRGKFLARARSRTGGGPEGRSGAARFDPMIG